MHKFRSTFNFSRQHLAGISSLILLILVAASAWVFWNEAAPPKKLRCNPKDQSSPSSTEPDPEKDPQWLFQPNQAGALDNFQPLNLAARPGFGLSTWTDAYQWSQALHAAWYIDWDIRLTRNFTIPEHWQMVRLSAGCISPSLDYIRWVAIHYPGSVWIIGNEPDVLAQDSINPEEYAGDYHTLSRLIKSSDATALIAVAGVAQGTQLRLAYLDRVLTAYQKSYGTPMPVDWWTLHGYVLREESGSWGVGIPPGFTDKQGQLYEIADHNNLALFKKQIGAFRTWMKVRGYQNTPLALTEFGILMPPEYGFTPEVIQRYLRDTFQWLATASDPQTGMPRDNDHLVQRWAWFSLADKIYPSADLADLKNNHLTQAGEAYRYFMLNSTR